MGIGYQKEIDNNPQSQTCQLFQYYLMRELKTDITLTSDISADDEIINVSAGHGFIVNDYVVIRKGDVFEQLKVVNVNINAITLEMPIANAFTISGTIVVRGDINLNVDGSVTPVNFYLRNYDAINSITPIDISEALLTMQHSSQADDGKFGGIAELTNGVYFRKENTTRTNLSNYTNNKRFRDNGANVIYTNSAPAGTFSTNIEFEIEDIFGQVIRLDPRNNDYLLAQVRDDLTALDAFTISIIGSYTQGE